MTQPAPGPIVDDPIAYLLAKELSRCLCTQLAATSAPTACCCLLPGQEVAWDDCTKGQAWVRVQSIYPVGTRFPIQDSGLDVGVCGTRGGWAVVLELGVLRCMPQPSGPTLPTCQQYDDVTRLTLADAHAMRRAVSCCDWRTVAGQQNGELVFGAWNPVGPAGVCVGGVMTVTVQSFGCICDPPAGTP